MANLAVNRDATAAKRSCLENTTSMSVC